MLQMAIIIESAAWHGDVFLLARGIFVHARVMKGIIILEYVIIAVRFSLIWLAARKCAFHGRAIQSPASGRLHRDHRAPA